MQGFRKGSGYGPDSERKRLWTAEMARTGLAGTTLGPHEVESSPRSSDLPVAFVRIVAVHWPYEVEGYLHGHKRRDQTPEQATRAPYDPGGAGIDRARCGGEWERPD